jgi:hypothetical protein
MDLLSFQKVQMRPQTHMGTQRPQQYKRSGCCFYLWGFLQECSQVFEVAVCQFLSAFGQGPYLVVGQKGIEDAKAAGKGKKEEQLRPPPRSAVQHSRT